MSPSSRARIAPTATASWPEAWWTEPGIFPLAVSDSRDSSNSRITSIVPSHSTSSSCGTPSSRTSNADSDSAVVVPGSSMVVDSPV